MSESGPAAVVVGTVDLSAPRSVHVVAVGGYAMSAIARYLTQLGHQVDGCDVTDAPILATLRGEGIGAVLGHDASHIVSTTDFVAVATAVRRDIDELRGAADLGVPILSRGETMRLIAATKPKVAVVSGTHGKTSTTSMLTAILRSAGSHPSFFVGGTIIDLSTNALYDPAGEWLIIEGDESDHSFLDFRRDAALVTNIDADHLDRWGDDVANLVVGFEEFVDGAGDTAVLCIDDPAVAAIAGARQDAITYGFAAEAFVRGVEYNPTPNGSRVLVEVAGSGGDRVELALRLRGRDMAQNAIGAFAMASALGVDANDAAHALSEFNGVARRFQYRGTHNSADCFDDYAHTATEVETTLARAREGVWSRVVAVFQPHRYSRIARHWEEFGCAFDDADLVVVTGLDAAFEDPIPGVSSELIVSAIRQQRPSLDVVSVPNWADLADLPWALGRPGDCIVTLGCGSITRVHDDWQHSGASR